MSIVLSDHAERQIKERKLSRKQLVETINSPDIKEKSFKNRRLRRKAFSDKMLEVVTVTEGSKITVITAYYLGDTNEN